MSTLLEDKWDIAARRAYKASHPDNFAGDDLDYPIRDDNDVKDAWDLARGPDQDKIRARVKAIAKRLGLSHALPDTAKDDIKQESVPIIGSQALELVRQAHSKKFKGLAGWQDASESAATITSSVVKPKKKIATLKVCFLEYNARSLNGRIYPKATCDKIYESLQRKLADSNALPMTCFVSHEAANGNANTELVGRVSGGSQDGNKFYALIDFADTRVAHDQLALVEGGYMRSESMRVVGVELVHDRNHDLPLVVAQEGVEPELMGIDLTTRPGLMDTARIQQVLYESAGMPAWQGSALDATLPQNHQSYTEAFTLTDVTIETQKGTPTMGIPLYLKVIADALELKEAVTADRAAHGRIHDHLAGVLDATIAAKHGSESARLVALAEAELSEEGKAIARKHAVKLAQAHDESARQMGMDCEGAYNEALGIAPHGDGDGDDDDTPINKDPNDDDQEDDGESAHQHTHKGEETLTEQEMIDALKAQGYTIPEKKSKEQELQEQFDAKLADQERKFNEKLAALEGAPQRKTQVASGFSEETSDLQPEALYEEGDYLKGTLAPKNWRALASPRTPWPADLDPELVLHELAPFMEHQILSMQYGAQGRSLKDAIAAGLHD